MSAGFDFNGITFVFGVLVGVGIGMFVALWLAART